MTGPPAAGRPNAGSAQIREQEPVALKFRSEWVDVLENNRRIEVISQPEARRRLAIGGYEAVGNTTVKYLRRIVQLPRPIDGPIRKAPPSAADNFTIVGTCDSRSEHRFSPSKHPWRTIRVDEDQFEKRLRAGDLCKQPGRKPKRGRDHSVDPISKTAQDNLTTKRSGLLTDHAWTNESGRGDREHPYGPSMKAVTE